jgi:16S rRNA (cytosine1402-N4)-methyltransferase
MLLDLGISSLQLDDPSRGFSFREEGPLDMRRDPGGGGPTAAEILRDASEGELADIFYRFGEERFSRRIARAVAERRRREPILTTTELARWSPRRSPAGRGPGTSIPPRGCSRRSGSR